MSFHAYMDLQPIHLSRCITKQKYYERLHLYFHFYVRQVPGDGSHSLKPNTVLTNLFRGPQTPKAGSSIWKKVRQLSIFNHLSSRWKIGNGRLVELWFDAWADDSCIK